MNRLLSIALVSTLMLAASPAMAERRHDYRNYDRGQRYEGRSHSRSNFGLSLGFGFSSRDYGHSNYGHRSYGGASYGYRNYSGCDDGYVYRPAYVPQYRPAYREVRVYRNYEPSCNTNYYRPAYDTGESYYATPRYYSSGSSYSRVGINYSSGGGGHYRGSYYSNYDAPGSHYSGSVGFRYGR